MSKQAVGNIDQFPDESLTKDAVCQLMRQAGCHRLLVKELAWNHDSKRQIYLTTDLSAFNLFPNRFEYDPPMPEGMQVTQKSRKRKSDRRIFGHLDFHWINPDGTTCIASEAKIIYYPQYPEVRLSGFLKGVGNVPSKYLKEKSGEVYTNRLLFLGVNQSNQVIAFLTVGHDSLRDELRQTSDYNQDAGLNTINLFTTDLSPKQMLLNRLAAIHNKGWIEGKKLTPQGPVPCHSPNAVGYTLEAELGILPNGDNAPDFMDWEVKAHTVKSFDKLENKVVTVFTPEPDMGIYSDKSVLEFMQRWGYDDRKGNEDRRNFGGIYRANTVCQLTGLTLKIVGYNSEKPDRLDPSGYIALMSPENEIAAGWSFGKLIDRWQRKHNAAVYLPAIRKKEGNSSLFQYADHAILCQGTDFLHVLQLIHEGLLYLDPALKALQWSNGKPTIKRRNQFRIKMKDVPRLYDKTSVAKMCEN